MKHVLLIMLSCGLGTLFCQPTIDASFPGGEGYATYNSGSRVWYMTWDATYLYIGLTNANETQGAIVYLDFQDVVPVNGSGVGTIFGKSDYGFAPDLPFRADAYVFFNNTNRAIRTGGGTWSTTVHGDDDSGLQSSTNTDYATNFYASNNNGNGAGDDDRREIRIAWNDLTGGGAPSQFNWLGYVGYSTGLYAQAPNENPGGDLSNGATPDMVRYFNVSNFGTPTSGFGQNSYTHIGGSVSNFGAITCHDFTMNSSGQTITRAATGEWGIMGDLVIGNGTVSCGSSSSQLNVQGNMRALNGGSLNAGSSSAPIIITGNLSLSGSSTVTLSTSVGGDLNLKGNFTQNSVFTCNNREVRFTGSSQQTLSGNFTGTNLIDFCRVNGAGIRLSADLEIEDRLTIENGNIELGNFDLMLTSGILEGTASSTTQSAFSATNMVLTDGTGKLFRRTNGSADLLFPVGTTGSYSAAMLSNSTITNEDFGINVSGTVDSPAEPTQVVNRQWDISEATPGDNDVTLTLYWNDGNEAASFDEGGMIVIGHFVGTDWVETMATVGSNSATASGFTSFSPFAVANAQALPVEFLSFTVNGSERGHHLNFATATETNNAYFNIERSTDSRQWEKLTQLAGAGTTQQEQRYDFLDATPLPGLNYYRIKQVDFDGTFSYSEIVSARWDGKTTVQLFPNPVTDVLQITGLPDNGQSLTLEVIDVAGRRLLNQNWNQGTLDVSSLPEGLYWLRIRSENGTVEQLPFLK